MDINTESITDQCYDMIWKNILDKKYLPGEQIPTKEIAKDNNISVMPVRLALRELTNTGIVVNKARVGFFVKDFTKQEMMDISEIRSMYEIYGLTNYFSRLDMGKLHKIYDLIYSNTGDRFSNILYQETDLELHSEFVKTVPNELMKQEYERIKPLFAIIIINDSSPEAIKISREEHLEILNHIFEGNQKATIHALEKHLIGVRGSFNTGK